MPRRSTSESVPQALQARYDEIVALTDAFCEAHLDAECAQLCRQMTATLGRKRLSPLQMGQANTWAAGIIHAIATVNFLFDKSVTPHTSFDDLAKAFGRAKSTIGTKSKEIRDLLKIGVMDPDWTLPSRIDHNPMAWRVSLDGMIVDARYLPRALQEEAYRRGLIPYVPDKKR
jgi:hypothetical protein